MKTQPVIVSLLALTLVLAPALFETTTADTIGGRYVARLIKPTAGEVLVPGHVYRIEWRSVLPELDPALCETELRLSLDGGRTFSWITGERDPLARYVDWVVPNTPTNNAVIDLHFGCLGYYPETSSIQIQSRFTISNIVDSPTTTVPQ